MKKNFELKLLKDQLELMTMKKDALDCLLMATLLRNDELISETKETIDNIDIGLEMIEKLLAKIK